MPSLLRAICTGSLALIGATSAHAACSLDKVTQMPLLSLGRHYAVMAGVEDVVRPMVVDTGAQTTTLKASVVRELAIKPDEAVEHARPVAGVGQVNGAFHLNAIPSKLTFGDLVFYNRSTTVAAMDDGKSPEANSIGLLGDDILSQYDVEFDFPAHLLTFYRAVGCYHTFLPWTGVYATIPFDHSDAKVVIDIILNQERTQAIVDTGNTLSFLSKSASALWGSSASDLAPTKARLQVPFNQAPALAVSAYTFARVQIGGDTFADRRVNVVDLDFPPASANLGLDYWSSRKIWISYPRGWMFVADDPGKVKLAYPLRAAPIAAARRAGALARVAGPN